jgi:hypothetical protein
MPIIDLTEDELAAVTAAVREKLDREWRYRMAPRLEPFRSALAKLDPSAAATMEPITVQGPLLPNPARARSPRRR